MANIPTKTHILLCTMAALGADVGLSTAFSMEEQSINRGARYNAPTHGRVFVTGDLKGIQSSLKRFARDKKYSPKQILIISDIEGPLIKKAHPLSNNKAQANGASPKTLKKLVENGYCVVVSTAWPDFTKTLKALKQVGLHEALNIQLEQTQTIQDSEIFAIYNGRVACARKVSKLEQEYFPQKAVTPQYILTSEERQNIKAIIFCEDSLKEISTFKQDIEKWGPELYPNLESIEYFRIYSNFSDIHETVLFNDKFN